MNMRLYCDQLGHTDTFSNECRHLDCQRRLVTSWAFCFVFVFIFTMEASKKNSITKND